MLVYEEPVIKVAEYFVAIAKGSKMGISRLTQQVQDSVNGLEQLSVHVTGN